MNPRGSTVTQRGTFVLPNGVEINGAGMVRVIVYTPNDRPHRRDAVNLRDGGDVSTMFALLVRHFNVLAELVQVVDNRDDALGYLAWEMKGGEMDIDRLMGWDGWVRPWHYVMNVRVPFQGTGDGTAKPRPSKPNAKLTKSAEFPALGIMQGEGEGTEWMPTAFVVPSSRSR